jgi:cytochrome d ubiquinol oxidase subunit I
LSKVGHLCVTFLVALGSNLSALWILIANAWMQNPVGAEFNPDTMRMELTSFFDLVTNPVAGPKFVHTVAAGYVAASMFVLGISSYYLLRLRDPSFAVRSFAVAAGFGLASSLSVIVLGDESGYTTGEVQKVKLAAIEAEWETEAPPAAFTVFGFPDQDAEKTHFAIKIPWVMGLIATRSVDTPVTGIRELKAEHEVRIRNGMHAYAALQRLKSGDRAPEAMAEFDRLKGDLGYGLLLKKYAPNVVDATPEHIRAATEDTIPNVAPLFWSFRIMVGLGFWFLFLFAAAFYVLARRRLAQNRWLMKLALASIPLPWVAMELGWIVAEYGRQPWSISEVLPTHLSVSSVSTAQVWFSLGGFVAFYTALLVVEMYLMFKYARLGPSSLGTGRYHAESGRGAITTEGGA